MKCLQVVNASYYNEQWKPPRQQTTDKYNDHPKNMLDTKHCSHSFLPLFLFRRQEQVHKNMEFIWTAHEHVELALFPFK